MTTGREEDQQQEIARLRETLRKLQDEMEEGLGDSSAELALVSEQLLFRDQERKKALASLREMEERFNEFVAAVTDIIYRYDLQERRFDFITPSFERQTGYGIPELMDDHVAVMTKLIHPDDLERVHREAREHQQGWPESGSMTIEYRMVRRDGRVLWVNETLDCQFTPAGVVTHANGIIRDITERKQNEEALRESENRFRGLFESMVEGTTLCRLMRDAQGRAVDYVIELANPAYCELTGIPMEEAIGTRATTLYGIQRPPFMETLIRVATTGEPERFEAYSELVERHFLITVFALGSDRFAAILDDITEQRSHQEERERLIQELEAKNTELDRFTYTVSHDLKSPLITITGYLSFMERDLQEENLAEVADYIHRISGAARSMEQLLDDLLALSRAGRLINPPEDIPLEDLVQEALSLTAGRLHEAGIQVEVAPELPVVYGDRQRLLEVLQNLIDNAAKFHTDQRDSRIWIEAREQGGETRVSVRDNGIGLETEQLRDIFVLFHQLDQESGGTGIGLTLVKRIIEVHGGRISVESDGPGLGATFSFILPRPRRSP